MSTVAVLVCLIAWSLATPRFAAPDEGDHVLKAAAVVRGQLIGKATGGVKSPWTIVTVPRFLVVAQGAYSCLAGKQTVTAACETKRVDDARGTTEAGLYEGRYPPLYYAIVGIPTLFGMSLSTLFEMRVVSDCLNALFLGLAITSIALWSRGRLLPLGVLVAATPSVLYFASVVNPNGLEISSALALWASGAVLIWDHRTNPPTGLVSIVALSGCTLSLMRGISPFWLASIVLSLLALGATRNMWRGFLHARAIRIALAVGAVCGALALAWVFGAHALDLPRQPHPLPARTTTAQIVTTMLGFTGWYVQLMIAGFGYFDAYAPLLTYYCWYAVVGFVVIAGIVVGRAREAVVLAMIVIGSLVIPIVVTVPEVRYDGYGWQGRYDLPFAVGIGIVGMLVVDRSRLLQGRAVRFAIVASIGTALAQVGAFAWALRRYSVGTAGPINFVDGQWQPPLGDLGVCLLFIVGVGFMIFVTLSIIVAKAGRAEPNSVGMKFEDGNPVGSRSRGDVPASASN